MASSGSPAGSHGNVGGEGGGGGLSGQRPVVGDHPQMPPATLAVAISNSRPSAGAAGSVGGKGGAGNCLQAPPTVSAALFARSAPPIIGGVHAYACTPYASLIPLRSVESQVGEGVQLGKSVR